jgi:tetratricopeptide (TPR) repeat protein
VSDILEIRKQAHEFVQAGDLDSALEEYRKLTKGEDVDPNIYNLMGDVFFKKGDQQSAFHQYEEAVKKYAAESLYSNAIAVCRKMLRLDPEYLDAQRLLGELFLEQGFTSEAIGYFLEYAGKLIDKGDLPRAVDSLKKVIEAAPGRVKVREQLAEVYTHLDLKDEARSELLAAGDLYARHGDSEKAAELRERAGRTGAAPDTEEGEVSVEGGGTDRVEIVHKRIGLAHHVPIDIDEVLSSFQEEVKKAVGEEDYQSHYDLGISYIDLGLFDEALAEFGVARKRPDLELKSIELAGRCFVEKGDVELAIEELRSGLDIEGHSDAEYLGLKYNLAMAYERLGLTDEATGYYEQICEMDPTFRDAKVRLEQLSKQT